MSVTDCIRIRDLFDPHDPLILSLFASREYPWELLPLIGGFVQGLIDSRPEGFTELCPGVLVGRDIRIAETATIMPPAVICDGCELRPGAYIRGNVYVGKNSVVGNSCELKNCILLEHVQVPHFNYVGDSVFGNYAHTGAGAICSNLKADKTAVHIHGNTEYDTGLKKVGAFLGDRVDVGCNCVLNPGTVIGQKTAVYPLTSVRGVIPADCIVKSMGNIVKKR